MLGTATVGAAYSFTVTASGAPTPTFSLTGANWLQINTNTGALSGTPVAGDVGTHSYTVVASNGIGSPVTQPFSVIVSAGTAVPGRPDGSLTPGFIWMPGMPAIAW